LTRKQHFIGIEILEDLEMSTYFVRKGYCTRVDNQIVGSETIFKHLPHAAVNGRCQWAYISR